VARNLTLAALAEKIDYTSQHISEVERAKSSVSEHFVTVVDRALDAGGRLTALYEPVLIERAHERQKRATSRRRALRSPEEVEDDVRRRAFIGLGLATVLLGPEAAARASAEDWERIAHAWSYEVATATDRRALLPGLAADLRRLQAQGGPQRAIAQLSSYVAGIAISNGDPALAHRWWTRARSAASAAGDAHLAAYVGGRQAVTGLYGAYSPAHVVALADEALAATSAPCAGRMAALAARAQALAMLGRQRQAREALRDVEAAYGRLPRELTQERISALGWPEQRLHHVASYCAMYTGEDGEGAREEALRLYTGATWHGPAQVKLHRAASEVDPQDAVTTLSCLSESQRSDRFVRRIAAHVLTVAERRKAAGAADLRAVLA
jgi:transcriptional regulator with XRE-family HTH domain